MDSGLLGRDPFLAQTPYGEQYTAKQGGIAPPIRILRIVVEDHLRRKSSDFLQSPNSSNWRLLQTAMWAYQHVYQMPAEEDNKRFEKFIEALKNEVMPKSSEDADDLF